MWSPPDPGKGVEGVSADVAGRRGGVVWKVDGCLLVLESTQIMGARPYSERAPIIMGARPHSERAPKNNGGAPSSCGRFGDFLLFFIAAKS